MHEWNTIYTTDTTFYKCANDDSKILGGKAQNSHLKT